MKHTDDRDAKLHIWAEESKVHPIPRIANYPRFRAVKFDSYEEMNAWKLAMLEALAKAGGAVWTK